MQCSQCQIHKLSEEFYPDKRYASGYSPLCLSCAIPPRIAAFECIHCHQRKNRQEFPPSKRKRTGIEQPCKACRREDARLRTAARPIIPFVPPTVMTCVHCGEDKPVTAFPPDKRELEGYGQPCLACDPLNVCTRCGLEKTPSEFRADPRFRSGHHTVCRRCIQDRDTRRKATIRAQTNKEKPPPVPKDPEAVLMARRERNAQRRPLRNQQHIDWLNRDGNRDRVNAKQRAKRATNPFPFREQEHKYVDRKRERRQARGKSGDPILRAKGQRAFAQRRARKKNLPHTFTMQERAFMMQYFGYACAICGRQEGFEWTIALDHWIPMAAPDCPGTVATNMLPLCHSKQGSHQSCNSTKLSRKASEWLIDRFGKRKASRILKAIEAYFAVVRQRATLQCAPLPVQPGLVTAEHL